MLVQHFLSWITCVLRRKDTHLSGVQQHTRVPYSSLSSKNMGLHCASGDMTLLEFIATSACVHFSKFHSMDEDEAPRERT